MKRRDHRFFPPGVAAAAAALLLAPSTALAAGPLAVLTEPGGYISSLRVLLVFICLIPWLAFCQFVNKDTLFVRRLRQERWNGIVLGGGIIGLALWILMPWDTVGLFAAGFGLWLVTTAGTCSTYVIIRNGLVDPGARVFTPRHIKSWLGGLGQKREQRMQAVERVRLSAHDGAKIPPPTDPNKMDVYETAQTLLFDAFWRRATEVELLLGRNAARLAYRIDGVVTRRDDLLEHEDAEKAITFIKQAAGLDPDERRRPQTGAIRGAISGQDGGMTEVEVRTSGTTEHERLSLKIVADESRLRIGDLGMDEKQQGQFEEVCSQSAGLVIVCGPKASGVTTTLYAALRSHDAFMQNLLTIERESLMELENITQHIYDSTKHEASYARQLQSVLRREPDVVMISECQDRETAHLAARAACDGKKIYMGMQARDCFDALKKLVSLAGDTDAVADALQAIVSQRLVRKLCIACRQAYRPDPQLLKKANLPADRIEHFYRPPPDGLVDQKGNPIVCPNCQASGYFGRTGVFEVLLVDEAVRDLIRNGQPMKMIEAQARKSGLVNLESAALKKVMDGVTGMSEVLRVLRNEETVNRVSRPKPREGG